LADPEEALMSVATWPTRVSRPADLGADAACDNVPPEMPDDVTRRLMTDSLARCVGELALYYPMEESTRRALVGSLIRTTRRVLWSDRRQEREAEHAD
jgi:hypothetical protein